MQIKPLSTLIGELARHLNQGGLRRVCPLQKYIGGTPAPPAAPFLCLYYAGYSFMGSSRYHRGSINMLWLQEMLLEASQKVGAR